MLCHVKFLLDLDRVLEMDISNRGIISPINTTLGRSLSKISHARPKPIMRSLIAPSIAPIAISPVGRSCTQNVPIVFERNWFTTQETYPPRPNTGCHLKMTAHGVERHPQSVYPSGSSGRGGGTHSVHVCLLIADDEFLPSITRLRSAVFSNRQLSRRMSFPRTCTFRYLVWTRDGLLFGSLTEATGTHFGHGLWYSFGISVRRADLYRIFSPSPDGTFDNCQPASGVVARRNFARWYFHLLAV